MTESIEEIREWNKKYGSSQVGIKSAMDALFNEIDALRAEKAFLEARNRELVEALKFYATAENWYIRFGFDADFTSTGTSPCDSDGGEIARAALSKSTAPEGEKEVCEWSYDDNEHAPKWDSSCGESWCFIDGGPKENRVRYCQGCGKPISIKEEQ